jgi:hypothetical protein
MLRVEGERGKLGEAKVPGGHQVSSSPEIPDTVSYESGCKVRAISNVNDFTELHIT